MSMEFDFSELKKELQALEKKVNTKVVNSALRAGAEPILNKQKDLVPVDTGETKSMLDKGKIKATRTGKKIFIGLNSNVPQEIVMRGFLHNYGFRGKAGTFWIDESFQQSKDEAITEMSKAISEGIKGNVK